MLFFEYLIIEIFYKRNLKQKIIKLIINAMQFKLNIISKKNNLNLNINKNIVNGTEIKCNKLLYLSMTCNDSHDFLTTQFFGEMTLQNACAKRIF